MGLLKAVGSALGLSSRDVAKQDPMQYSELYDQAMKGLNGVGGDTADARGGLISGVQDQLGGLANNSAGRKAAFGEDMARNFAADSTSMARARGGTGSLINAQRAASTNYDAQARQTARGYNDLYSQATQDLGALNGIQSNLYGQDMQKQTAIAGTAQGELAARRGITAANTGAQNQANAEQSAAMGSLLGGAAKFAAGKWGGQ